MPRRSSENAKVSPAHHKADGGRSMGRQTSSVTAPGFLCPVINGIRSGEQTSAILVVSLFDDLEVVHRRSHIQLFQHAILAAVTRQAGDAAVWLVEVAENNRAHGARLLAGGTDITVLD